MPKLNGFEFLTPIKDTQINVSLKRIAHTVNYGVYIDVDAKLYLHDIMRKKVIPFKTSKIISNMSTIDLLFTTYRLINQ